MNILVTGCAGFIGYHTTQKLLNLGHSVIGVDNLNEYYSSDLKKERLNQIKSDNFYFYYLDICNTTLENIFLNNKIDLIIHLAAQAGVRYSLEKPFVYEQYNNYGFLNILEIAKKFKIKKVIYASSSSVYGNSEKEIFSEKDETDKPISIYAATKKFNEILAYSYSHLFNISLIGLRFFTVYGPWGRPDMALFKFTKAILQEKEIEVYNNGEMFRDFTYIDDIVDGIISCIEYNSNYDIFNLGCGNPRKLIDFIDIISKECQKKPIINFLPLQKGDVLRTSADISKAKDLLNFNPKIQIETGLKNFIEWYKKYEKIFNSIQ